ncbi:hypothetical protein O5282_05575 [Escherichia coli]|nr:hypothetical protein [Escherichia coli]
MSVFFSGDVTSARRFTPQQTSVFAFLIAAIPTPTSIRLHQQNVQSIETSSLHLGLAWEICSVWASLFCSVAYSVLEQPDEDEGQDQY